ncbi:MAG: hypothetical protein UU47_C0030G0010 [candidate division TM6 bacterium GW2011_GWE2_41_16]|nr:MAG: hypothetical protein UU47_C0030G0010 [candidate division TM6 bacterium GW2011_GWE2_41_16]
MHFIVELANKKHYFILSFIVTLTSTILPMQQTPSRNLFEQLPLELKNIIIKKAIAHEQGIYSQQHYQQVFRISGICHDFNKIIKTSCAEHLNASLMDQQEIENFLKAPKHVHARVRSMEIDTYRKLLYAKQFIDLIDGCPNTKSLKITTLDDPNFLPILYQPILSNNALGAIAKLGKQLINFEINANIIDDSTLIHILTNCRCIKTLKIKSTRITPKGLVAICHLIKNLTSLDIVQDLEMENDVIFEHIFACCPHINTLRLKNAGIRYIPKLRQSLTHLELCSSNIDDTRLQEILSSCPNLQSLSLIGCHHITSAGFSSITQNSFITELCINDCTGLDDHMLSTVLSTGRIKKLVLVNCPNFTPVGFLNILKCHDLTEFCINNCTNFDDTTLDIALSAGHIEKLELTKNPNLTDTSFISIARTGTHLVELTVIDNNNITNPALCHILAACPRLQKLHVDLARSITLDENLIRHLATHNSLCSLHFEQHGRDYHHVFRCPEIQRSFKRQQQTTTTVFSPITTTQPSQKK